ncbi:ATP-dependent RNA helicase DBP7 [Spathaspora passalidarum NRRL Y-27907]|uniref:ATP-dependent RNA helicase n=1 Tax=Spathaspora passalidarum (strain NRRL Y-27907 / 11-Y1) TaxID=619300 RepID=G3AV53_SPAPN|nr:ATP-dependent RNA helicase DBP7 [Spathaspora passalidarum NRRL Y-27907]EGW30127.1 ATP-dependent RNA helicase DBP7 [Spathaspora passalidarum NRRL Y-27907]
MSEDDGLLLNFASADTPSVSSKKTAKVSGGNWKERRKLQLRLTGRGANKKNDASGVNKITVDSSRMERVKQANKEAGKDRGSDSGSSRKRVKFAESKGESGGKDNSYVSSLFTSNAETTTLKPTTSSKTYDASNAPLSDSTTFPGLGINEKLSTHLTDHLRFKHPTKIQRMVIPTLLAQDNDVFVKAQTGSGKTLAFLLPLFHRLMSEDITRESGLFAVILTPTRELATQIYGVLETLTRCHHRIVPGIVIGGEKKKSEKARLRKGVNILVATPGRLADHLENTKTLDVSQLRYLILDEGDKLVELGFEETITSITNKISQNSRIHETLTKWKGLPSKRINVLCSATMQNNVEKLGSIILQNPTMIQVEKQHIGTVEFEESEVGNTAPDQLIQNIVVVPPKLRLVTLNAMLSKYIRSSEASRTIVFFSCSDSVNFHFEVFTRNGKNPNKKQAAEDIEEEEEEEANILTAPGLSSSTTVYKLHGSLSQKIRTSTLNHFIKDTTPHQILFCTDVASRGLDLPNIANVIEYDPPFTIDDHLHRIGRSARLGNKGNATLFLMPGIEEAYVDGKLRVVHPNEGSLRILNYEQILEDGFAEVQEEGTAAAAAPAKKNDPKRKTGKWDIHATTWHLDIERWLLEDTGAHDRAGHAFTSHIRAYATHLSSERDYFNVKLLHLGHLAKSFGLRETPKKLGKSINHESVSTGTTKRRKKDEDPRKKMLRMARLAVNSASSEFNY